MSLAPPALRPRASRMASCHRRCTARGGTLVLGGGFAGAYVARLLGKRGATIVSPESSMLYTPLLPEAASGTLEPRHVVVPLRQMCPHAELVLGTRRRSTSRRAPSRPRRSPGRPRSPTSGSWSRSARSTASSRCPGSPSTAAASRTSPTRSPSATTSCSGSRRPPRAAPPSELGFVFVGAGYAGSRRSPSSTTSRMRRCATTRRCATYPSAGCSSMRRRRSCPRSRAGSGRTPRAELERRGVEIHVGETLASYDGETAVLSGGTAVPARTLVWTAGVKASPLLARARAAARRARPGPRRRDAPGRGPRRRLVARRLRRRAQRAHARARPIRRPASTRLRQARRLAKNLTGEPRALRLPHARPGRDARPLQGDRRRDGDPRLRASRAGSSPARTTSTRCRS